MINYTTIIVQNAKEKDTIYTYLKSNSYSETYLTKLRKSDENILLNYKHSFIINKVKNGDEIKLNVNPYTKTSILKIDKALDIVFEDDYLLVVNKPSGISCMPNKSHYTNNLAGMIVNYMESKDQNFVLRIINRLDKDTQGIILVAKDAVFYKHFLENAKKVYHALLEGKVDKTIINSPIENVVENNILQLKRIVSSTGKPAVTDVTPIKYYKDFTLCKISLTYGRTHQIRVHCSSINHALVGDYLYGKPCEKINHTALVCKEVSLIHPVTKQNLIFEVDYEHDFKKLLNEK